MTVRELQDELRKMPADKEVWYWYDGKPRGAILDVSVLGDTDPDVYPGGPPEIAVVLHENGITGPRRGDRFQLLNSAHFCSWGRGLIGRLLSWIGV